VALSRPEVTQYDTVEIERWLTSVMSACLEPRKGVSTGILERAL
jgi:hypothetical protein